jgi:lipopolysaccharide biosynthesis protein
LNLPSVQRLKTALSLLFPSRAHRGYARQIRDSGLFDRRFYVTSNPALHPIVQWLPIRHFVLRGEATGLWPNAGFSPAAYLRHNPDLHGKVSAPFSHFIRSGRLEQRLTLDLPAACESNTPVPRIRSGDRPSPQARFAVVVHIYYPELWPEFASRLRDQEIGFDLFVTIVGGSEGASGLQHDILAAFPQARVWKVPNRGRDILPFLHVVNSGVLNGYEAVCKLHSKKSPHRSDGELWRRHLIRGLLGPGAQTRARLEHFLADARAAFWVADGQIYRGQHWWGTNRDQTRAFLRRVEVEGETDPLQFAAGSMYWMKPLMLDMLRGMRLSEGDFQSEQGQTDGTSAHAIERATGALAYAAGQRIVQASTLDQRRTAAGPVRPTYTTAFYLPQFHPTAENDRWWGKGFTEWRGVSQARPVYPGHGQPALPADLGFYDLRLSENLAAQRVLARRAGIDAFCVYHYWFDGKRMLQQPLDVVLGNAELEFPFYLCWANESWRRNWDGLSGEVLIPQSYRPGFARALAQDVLRYFRDPRYQRPDGTRPRFVIYRPEDMPDPIRAVAEMRQLWHEAGIGEVELGAVLFHISGPGKFAEDLFDFYVEMPPHGLVGADDYLVGGSAGNRAGLAVSPGFDGVIYDYRAVAKNSLRHGYVAGLPQNTIAGIMPGWDNSARRGNSAHIAWGGNPAQFRRWLGDLCAGRLPASYRGELFVNAWNEWAEKAMLEPCLQYGDANLRCLAEFTGGADRGGRDGGQHSSDEYFMDQPLRREGP